MGKQINYWLGYEEFLQIAQAALDCGCVIVKPVSGKLTYGQSIDMITETEYRYFFYVPEAGALSGKTIPFGDSARLGGCSAEGNTVISAGFSPVHHDTREIVRSRMFVSSGYYDSQGNYVPRPECVVKVYQKLARPVKKLAPYTELTDTYTSIRDETYLQEKVWRHKEYITPRFLELKLSQGYTLRV